jgi:hypothetical protein
MKKKMILLAILSIVVALVGCDVAGLFNPLIGKWSTTVMGVMSFEFRADMTCEQSTAAPDGTPISSITGTYKYTDTQIDFAWSDGTSLSILYSIDGKVMTAVPTTGGISLSFVKQ